MCFPQSHFCCNFIISDNDEVARYLISLSQWGRLPWSRPHSSTLSPRAFRRGSRTPVLSVRTFFFAAQIVSEVACHNKKLSDVSRKQCLFDLVAIVEHVPAP